MKAVVKYALGEGNVELRDISVPSPTKGQVLIKVESAAICGSDIHILHNNIHIPLNPPVVMGHEFSGTVAENGEGCEKYKIGERVVSEVGFDLCGICEECFYGFPNLCKYRKSGGYWYNGAFTNFMLVPEKNIHPMPGGLSFDEAALIEPLACAVHGVLEQGDLKSGENVLISGPGAIGLLSLQCAKSAGGYVIVAGLKEDADRLETARKLGADKVLFSDSENFYNEIHEITSLRGGVDVFYECSGSAGGVATGLKSLKKRGKYTQIGLMGKTIPIDIDLVTSKELIVNGSQSQRRNSWDTSLKLIEMGLINLKPLITDIFPLSEWKKGFELFESKKSIKVILRPET